MTYRSKDASSTKEGYSQSKVRLSPHAKNETSNEGCPVIEDSGTVCGETNDLSIIDDFRKVYDGIIAKIEKNPRGHSLLKKLAPLKSLMDDLWVQNRMLVETVEELEEEATATVSSLQDKLNKSCQKLNECQEDINSLIQVIHELCEYGETDFSCFKFYTFRPSCIFSDLKNSNHGPAKKPNARAQYRKIGNPILPNRGMAKSMKRKENDRNDILSLCYMSHPSISSMGNESQTELYDPRYPFTPKHNCGPLFGEYVSELVQKSPCSELCASNDSKGENQFKPEYPSQAEMANYEESRFDGHIGQININLNIGTDGNLEAKNYCPCDCSFTTNNSNEL